MNSEQEQLLYEIAQRTARVEESVTNIERELISHRESAKIRDTEQNEKLQELEQAVERHETIMSGGVVLITSVLSAVGAKIVGWF